MLHSNAEKSVREHMRITFCSLMSAKLFSHHAIVKRSVLCLLVHIALSGKRFLRVGSELVSSQAESQSCLHSVLLIGENAASLPNVS